jgi:N-acyl-D-aspartate/D-glutamate deacylase
VLVNDVLPDVAAAATGLRDRGTAAEALACDVVFDTAFAQIIGLTKSVARYAAPFGINVNCSARGLVATELSDGLSEAMRAATIGRISAGRLGRPEESANAALY